MNKVEKTVGIAADFTGLLSFNDQFRHGKSLGKTLSNSLDTPRTEEGAIYFDSVDMVDGDSNQTIVEDALCGQFTFAGLLRLANLYYTGTEALQ